MMIKRIINSIVYRSKRLLQRGRSDNGAELVGMPEAYNIKQKFQTEFLKSRKLSKSDTFLDLGCGVLRGGIPVIQYLDKGLYYGIDVRQESIKIAERQVRKLGLMHKSPNLYFFSDLDEAKLDKKFNIIWSFSVLFHLTDPKLATLVEFVANHLKSNGIFYANAQIGSRASSSWQDFPVEWRSFGAYKELAHKNGLSLKDIGKIADYGHHISDLEDTQRMLKFELQ